MDDNGMNSDVKARRGRSNDRQTHGERAGTVPVVRYPRVRGAMYLGTGSKKLITVLDR
jgi:hypothetical protein